MRSPATLPVRVLHWNEREEERQTIRRILERSGSPFEISESPSWDCFVANLSSQTHDVALAPFCGAAPWLSYAVAIAVQLPILLLVDPADESAALAALEQGASDYVLNTPLQRARLPYALQLAARTRRSGASESSRQNQAQLLASIPDAIFATDLAGAITDWNPAAESLYGWSATEVLGKSAMAVLQCPMSIEERKRVRDDLNAGLPYRHEHVHTHRDGRQIVVEMVCSPIRDADGAVRGYVTVVHDLTDRNRARETAWETEARLQFTCRAASEAIADLDVRTGKVWRSEGYQRLFGYRAEDMAPNVGWWIKRVHPDDLDRLFHDASALSDGVNEFTTEYRFRRADGTYADVLHRGYSVRNPDGMLIRVMTTMIDLTLRNRTELALAESEKRYRLLADNTTDMIVRVDYKGVILYVSPASETLTGYRPDEMAGVRGWRFCHREDVRLVHDAHASALASNSGVTVTFRAKCKNGGYVWLETTTRALFDPAGPGGAEIVCVARDVSARRQAEELLRIQQAELAHISRLTSMGEMASGIAHELNQPLAAISHYVDACRETIRKDHSHAENLLKWTNKIADQAERAGDIIRRIKGFVQKSQPERRQVDAQRLLGEVLELLDPDAKLHDIQLDLEAVTPLPTVHVDKVQIQQVLVNLLRNAFEAIDECRATDRTVVVSATSLDPWEVLVSVSDRGVGIPPAQLERVFEPFFTTKPDGTGVGLAISRTIVEDHGGRLWAVNNAGQGTTFWFTLPTAHEGAPDGEETRSVRGGRRQRASRGAAVDLGIDGP